MILLTKQPREPTGSLAVDVFSNQTIVSFWSTHLDETTLSVKKEPKCGPI